jgi:hypothetical protein
VCEKKARNNSMVLTHTHTQNGLTDAKMKEPFSSLRVTLAATCSPGRAAHCLRLRL